MTYGVNRMDLHTLTQDLIPKQIDQHVALHQINIRSIEMDSRKVQPGSLFVCLSGFNMDGHQFAAEAVQNGAIAVMAEKAVDVSVPVIIVPDTRRALAFVADRFYDSPTRALRLIGVTGTNGKTTITHLIAEMLEQCGYRTGRMGTINMQIGDIETPLANTTPESLELQKGFRQMVDAGCSHAVIEASSHAIHMGRVRGCNFGTVVFSNLTQDHLDYHGTMANYKQAKGLLFAQLGNRYDPEDLKFAILNADDPAYETYRTYTPAQVLTYGIHNRQADIKAKNIVLTPQGTSFTVEYLQEEENIEVRLLGQFNVYNVLGAIGAGLVEGLTLKDMKNSLLHVDGVPGRMEAVDAGQDFSVIVDYAHTPDSLENALATIKQFAQGKIFCIVGCGGDRDRTKRPLMAHIASRYADVSVLTSDNPRSEDPEKIILDMKEGLISNEVPQNKYQTFVERREAIHWAIQQAAPDDVILIAGKGHETYQEIKGRKYHFNDKQVALEALKTRM